MKIVVVEDAGCMKCPSDFLFGHDFFPGKHTVRVHHSLPSYQRALKTETDLRSDCSCAVRLVNFALGGSELWRTAGPNGKKTAKNLDLKESRN